MEELSGKRILFFMVLWAIGFCVYFKKQADDVCKEAHSKHYVLEKCKPTEQGE